MGSDKAHLQVGGEPLAHRIARKLRDHCSRVTVLGREPIAGCGFLADQEEFSGPLSALARFTPTSELIMVASCDLPCFDGRLVQFLMSKLEGAQAVVPQSEGHLQPLCALYSARAWPKLKDAVVNGKKSLMAWLDCIPYRTVSPEELAVTGMDPRAIQGANSPEELAQLLR